MKFAHAKTMEWSTGEEQHRGGGLALKHLLDGEEGTLENFRLVLGRDGGGHESPRHRHNFDQIRMVIQGTLSITADKTMKPGQVGYFPEGTPYGPQKDGLNERIALVLQFGGVSGSGFISTRQIRAGYTALSREGEFKGGVFHRTSSEGRRNQDGFEAVWEHIQGRRLSYPPPRFVEPILMNPANFAWIADDRTPGVARKLLGVFTERGTRIEMVRLGKDAQVKLGDDAARLLVFAVAGEGSCGDERWFEHSALQIEPGERATLAASEPAELLLIHLPMLAPLRLAAE
jgi:quercetin dioxygenase-like cupin family protein